MTYSELAEIIANGENSGVEFKRDDLHPAKVAKELVAFANFRGGMVLLGVEDSGQISGLTRPNCEEWVMDTVIGRYITPSFIPYYEQIQTPQGTVAVVRAEQGISKPYAVRDQDKETIYIRVGSTSRIADRDQILRMSQESGYYHFEIAPIPGTTPEDLDAELFLQFYKKNFFEELKSDDVGLIFQKMKQLDLAALSSAGQLVCTVAGMILFGKNPGTYLPQSGFRVVIYKGDDISLDSISDKRFSLPFARLINGSNIIKNGLADRVVSHLGEYLSEETILQDGLTRRRVWMYPEEILRELIVNAVIHRDYTRKGMNEIRIFSDRIEFESQGRLPNTLTVEKILAGQKYPRNPILVQFGQYFELMEHKGLGIRKVVLPALQKAGFPAPEFIDAEDSFTVIVRRK